MQKELLYRDIEELPPELYPEVHSFIMRVKDEREAVATRSAQPVKYGGFESDEAAARWASKQISRWWDNEPL
jgi:DNA replication initiation complex subunit (GINS family)